MSHIHSFAAGSIGTIVMDRPQRFNALDVEMARDLRKAALQMARDQSIRVVILEGGQKAFCSGADLKYVRQKGDEHDFSYLKPDGCEIESDYGTCFKEILEYLHSTISEIRRAPKPFVASVKGIAAAGGFGLAMCCDLVYATESAAFEWAYTKTGLTGAESSTFLISRLIGLRRAFELVFLNPKISARQAHELGLITEVLPEKEYDERLMNVSAALAQGPTGAWAVSKRLINEAAGMDRLDNHLDRELRSLADIARGSDFAEGIDAFFEKRPARFKGDQV